MSNPKPTFVTSNKGKAREVGLIFRKHKLGLKVFYAETLEIQSGSLLEISVLRALQAHKMVGGPVFVEDSGLFIQSLKGFPGPFSSYVYRTLGVEGVLRVLGDKDRKAVFKSVVCYFDGLREMKTFEGNCQGKIAAKPAGKGGFGFDPVFIPAGQKKTFAEMSVEEKNRLSHRSQSVSSLCRWLYKVRRQRT